MDIGLGATVGILMLILGHSYVFQARLWQRYAGELMAAPQQSLVLGLWVLLLGLIVVSQHNIWLLGWPVVVTLIGWSMVLKGTVYLLYPQLLGRFSDWDGAGMRRYIRGAGMLITLLGIGVVYHYLIA